MSSFKEIREISDLGSASDSLKQISPGHARLSQKLFKHGGEIVTRSVTRIASKFVSSFQRAISALQSVGCPPHFPLWSGCLCKQADWIWEVRRFQITPFVERALATSTQDRRFRSKAILMKDQVKQLQVHSIFTAYISSD